MNTISYMICVCSKFTSMFLSESFSPVDIRPRSASDKRPSFTLLGCGSSNTDVQSTESWEENPAEAVEQHPDYRQQADMGNLDKQ